MINRTVIAVSAAALAVSLATLSTHAQATPETVTVVAKLSPANEVPPVTNAEAKGSGDVTVTFQVTRDSAKAVTGATASFNANLSGFPAGTAITAAHIHTGVAGTNGGPAVNTGLKPGEVTLATGSGSFSKTGVTVTPAAMQDILNNPAGFYFNVHSEQNKAGAARGQLEKK